MADSILPQKCILSVAVNTSNNPHENPVFLSFKLDSSRILFFGFHIDAGLGIARLLL